jgi:hypothetical protein
MHSNLRTFRTLWLLAALASAAGCQQAPEVRYVTDRLEIAPDFDHEVCQGTLDHLDEHVTFVENELTRWIPPGERIRYYWLTDGLDGWCSDGAAGCYYPGTHVVIGDSSTVTHEIVHAVLDAEARTNLFLEEALAEVFSGVGAYHDPTGSQRPEPSELLWLSPAEYREGDLDYRVASHFMSYLYRTHGRAPIRGLASTVVAGSSPDEIESVVLDEFKLPFSSIEETYIDEADSYYRGLADDSIESVKLKHAPLEVELDCGTANTYGPLWDGGAGTYRVFSTWVDEPTRYELTLHGPDELELRIIDLRRQRSRGVVVDWHNPHTLVPLKAPTIHGGETHVVDLSRGRYLLVYSTEDYEPLHATLSAALVPTLNDEIPP